MAAWNDGVVPMRWPDFDDTNFVKTTINFLSGTPPMAFWCSFLTLDDEHVILESQIDGKRQVPVQLRRERISSIEISFEAPAPGDA